MPEIEDCPPPLEFTGKISEPVDDDGPPPLDFGDDGPPPLEIVDDDSDEDDGPPPLEDLANDGPPPLEDLVGDSPPPLEELANDGPPPLRDVDDEDGPPPLEEVSNGTADDKADEGPTMQEMMMAEGNKAREAKQKRLANERKEADQTFGDGMDLKKAFAKKKKKAKPKKAPAPKPAEIEDEEEDVVELGVNGFDLTAQDQVEEISLDAPELQGSIKKKEEGNKCFMSKDFEQAIRIYEICLEGMPANAPKSLKSSVYNNRATCHFHLKQYDKAVTSASSALSFDKKYVKALYRRGLSYQKLGQLEQATKDLKKTIRLDPNNKLARKTLHKIQNPVAMPTISKNKEAKTSLHLPEVQEALNSPGINELKKGQWCTPDLMQKMAQNPRIQAGMRNPYYMETMKQLETDPKAAMEKCNSDPGLKDFIQEWMGMMGGHFDKLADTEEEKTKKEALKAQKAQQEAQAAEAARMQPQAEVNPITGKEIRWDDMPKSKEADEQVQKIMADTELSKLLQDPEMHKVLQKCGEPGGLQHFLRDPEWGPKIRMMADAGLVQIQR
jgi:tetratricopeptide (TPR) repeat protein